ncbi:MAG: cation:proton antiporter [Gammaproteobacteria bacterium]|nr:cation:proton antiporter [Gammaproteobacteria bacterium]
MTEHSLVFSIFLIFSGAAAVATLALFARQSMLVAYILVGMLVGPSGFGLINDVALIRQTAEIGIIFLLFLLGMSLEPKDLVHLLKKSTIVTLISSVIFFLLGAAICLAFGYTPVDSVIVGLCMMFSSTIIGLKLLPTTALHHQHMGEVIVSVLLLQDILAILVLLLLQTVGGEQSVLSGILHIALALVALTTFAFLTSRYVLHYLLARFDRIQEYVFLLAIGWCLLLAELAVLGGLSHEIGAFIGGVSLAISPIARFITESLKPLRDFFLIIFFFTLGAGFELSALQTVAAASIVLAVTMLLLKPLVFRKLLRQEGEKSGQATQTGVRLGQVSEFALLIAVVALQGGILSQHASYLIQVTTLLTFIASSYYIVARYPTPISTNERLRRD